MMSRRRRRRGSPARREETDHDARSDKCRAMIRYPSGWALQVKEEGRRVQFVERRAGELALFVGCSGGRKDVWRERGGSVAGLCSGRGCGRTSEVWEGHA